MRLIESCTIYDPITVCAHVCVCIMCCFSTIHLMTRIAQKEAIKLIRSTQHLGFFCEYLNRPKEKKTRYSNSIRAAAAAAQNATRD